MVSETESMNKRKTTLPNATASEKALLAALEATRGVPSNVRPAGTMNDRRTKRLRTRAAQTRAALDEA